MTTEPEVIHRDDDLLVVLKPAGVPTTAPSGSDACLVRWVQTRFPTLHAHPTSRLDSPVSGLVTFALHKGANRRLLEARRSGAYHRRYLGISLRAPEPDAGRWDWPISIDPRSHKRRVAGSGRGERAASTDYSVVARTAACVLLALSPRTGRTHQLRVHAAEAGAPLFGDHTYGGARRFVDDGGRVVTARRVMLHCAAVGFPWGSDTARFRARVPSDFEQVWSSLGGVPADLTPDP